MLQNFLQISTVTGILPFVKCPADSDCSSRV